MRKIMNWLFLLCIPFLLAACNFNSTSSNNAVPNNYFDKTATLQGTLFDAVTGARLKGSGLKITLVQGTAYRNPNVLRNNPNETTFAGDYAFAGIPISLNGTNGETTYRIVATDTGYQQFEGTINFKAVTGNTLDQNYNYVGNIYMYPLGTIANDVTVKVLYNNQPVTGATVQLEPVPSSNLTIASKSSIYASPQPGFLPNLTATTDASGNALFSGKDLVLGGEYTIVVLPTTINGTPLQEAVGTTFNAGFIGSSTSETVNMVDVVPGTSNGLYVTSQSNMDSSTVASNGVLTMTFSRPVTIVDPTAFTAVLSGTTVNAVLAAPPVSASLSPDGLTLTLTPSFSTAPVAYNGSNAATADNGLVVTYSGGAVRLTGTAGAGVTYSVFGLTNELGNIQSGAVLMTPNF